MFFSETSTLGFWPRGFGEIRVTNSKPTEWRRHALISLGLQPAACLVVLWMETDGHSVGPRRGAQSRYSGCAVLLALVSVLVLRAGALSAWGGLPVSCWLPPEAICLSSFLCLARSGHVLLRPPTQLEQRQVRWRDE